MVRIMFGLSPCKVLVNSQLGNYTRNYSMYIRPTAKMNGMDLSELDKLADQTMKWQKVIIEHFGTITTLELENRELKKALETSEDHVQDRKIEISHLLEQITNLQTILSERCNSENENLDLKDQLTLCKKQAADKIEEHLAKIVELEESLVKQSNDMEQELREQESRIRREELQIKETFEQEIEEKNAEIARLSQVINDREIEKQQEISKLKAEFESRLSRIKQQASASQQSGSFAACKDIFRKKWEHAKIQYEREIAQLRVQLATSQHRAPQPHTPATHKWPRPCDTPAQIYEGRRMTSLPRPMSDRGFGDLRPRKSTTSGTPKKGRHES